MRFSRFFVTGRPLRSSGAALLVLAFVIGVVFAAPVLSPSLVGTKGSHALRVERGGAGTNGVPPSTPLQGHPTPP